MKNIIRIDIMSPKNLQLMCRFCLRLCDEKSKCYPVFGKYYSRKICDMIKFVYGLKIQVSDPVTNLCEECLVKLDIVEGVTKEVRRANTQLLDMLRKHSVKLHEETPDKINEINEEKLPLKITEDRQKRKDDLVKCNICNLMGGSEHLNTHANLIPYNCNECNIEINDLVDLNIHLPIHNENIDNLLKDALIVVDEIIDEELFADLELETPMESDVLGTEFIDSSSIEKNRCYICDTEFPSNLDIHLKEHESVSLCCEICEDHVKFPNIWKLNEHLAFHDEDHHFKCKLCYMRFKFHSSMQEHLSTHSVEILETIEIAHSKIKTKKTKPKMKHSDENYQCSFCGKQFTTKPNLRVHENCVHTLERKYSCKICDKVYGHASLLKKHLLNHTGELPYQCEFCKKRFKSHGCYRDHTKLHTGEKPYECQICNRRFRTNQWFVKHRKTQGCAKVKIKSFSYQCPVCEKNHTDFREHHAHMADKHPENTEKFVCNICEMTFQNSTEYAKHRTKSHRKFANKKIKCDTCGKMYATKQHLSIHMTTHTGEKQFKCKVCEKPFAVKVNLKRHLLLHEKKRFKCEYCEREFHQPTVLKVHLRLHTGEKPYACQYCGIKFGDYSTLIKHRKKIHAH